MVLIFYKNKKKHKKTSEKDLLFSIFADGVVSNIDDLVAKPNQCKSCYNLAFKDGALKTGMGFSDFTAPSSEAGEGFHKFNYDQYLTQIDQIWLYRWFNTDVGKFKYQIMMYDNSTKLLWAIPLIDEYAGMLWEKTSKITSFPTFQCLYRIDNNDTALFFTNEGMVFLSATTEGKNESVPAMISGVVHYDNFFGITNTNRNTLVYTSNLNLTTWTETEGSTKEFLDNRGAFTKLVGFNDYVYLFREHGITKLSIYTTKEDFSVTHLYTSSSRIYEKTVCVCGDKILFMTRDGLYSFNGSSVSKVGEQHDKYFRYLDNKNASAVCLNGKYYLASKYNFEDDQDVGCEQNSDFVNNVLFEIDVETFEMNLLRGVDINNMIVIDCDLMCKLCACFNSGNKAVVGELNSDGCNFDEVLAKNWVSYKTDLGYRGKRKKVKEIIINTLYDCEVEIETDEEKKIYSFNGDEKEQRLAICVHGSVFQFAFKTNLQNCEISKPMIVFDVVE